MIRTRFHAGPAGHRRRVALATLAVAAALSMTASSAPFAIAAGKPHTTRAPRFVLPGRGETVALDSLNARLVLVDFWASWCVPCRKSFPWMASLHQRYGGQGLRIVAINLDKERDAAEQFITDLAPPFTIAFDPEGKTADAFHVRAMPSSFLIDSTGAIVYAHAGFDPKKTAPLEAKIQEVCAK